MDELDRLYDELTITKELEDTRGVLWWGGYISALRYWHVPNGFSSWTGAWYKYAGGKDIVYRNRDRRLHRVSGPAYVNPFNKSEEWYRDGKLHREDGPAIIHKQTMLWYKDGKLHNLDGPAIVDPAGPSQYWINGQRLSPKEYRKEILRRKRKNDNKKKPAKDI